MKLKIAFTGPESTGKTTLAQLVSNHYDGIYIPEFARSYLEKTGGKYSKQDLDVIAKGQFDSVKLLDNNDKLLVVDTEMTVIKVWSLYKYNEVSKIIEDLYQKESFDHIFLCDTDILWEEDPLRENPENREELFEIYLRILKQDKRSFSIVSGPLGSRLQVVTNKIDDLRKFSLQSSI